MEIEGIKLWRLVQMGSNLPTAANMTLISVTRIELTIKCLVPEVRQSEP